MVSIKAVRGDKQVCTDFISIDVKILHENAIKRLKEFMDKDADIEAYSIFNEPLTYKD